MATRRSLSKLITSSVEKQPLNEKFVMDVQSAIEKRDRESRRQPSKWYKPSSLVCMRQMYFMRTEAPTDGSRTEYTMVGMADTGTRRHEAIQEVLESMSELGYDWKYLDVAEHIKEKQKEGKCKDLEVVGKRGAETKLFHKTLLLSFMCDGILEYIPTGQKYLFEFKNQISFKAQGKEEVDSEHLDQVTAYCLTLDLDYALVLYENRDVCELKCPQLLSVTQEMKQVVVDKIMATESHVEKRTTPPIHPNIKPCRWCQYKAECRKAGQ